MRAVALLAALLGIANAAIPDKRQSQASSAVACNNAPELCSRPYNTITYLGAHDAPFLRDASTGYSTSGNQYYNSTVQLAAGVRLLTAQVHNSNDEWHLCHTSCDLLDAGLLTDWLAEIKAWLDANPNDVVTVILVNSDNASIDQLSSEFDQSGIVPYAYVPPSDTVPQETWPTLQALIDAKLRLMVFIASLESDTVYGAGQNYLMNEFNFIFENPYTNTNVSSFTCTPNRPSSVEGNTQAAIDGNYMSLMNHFLDSNGPFGIDTPDVDAINSTNSPGTALGNLGQAAEACKTEYGKQPNFLLVDFFDEGPAIATVDSLNGITSPVGRIQPPPRDTSSSLSTTSFAGVANLVAEVASGQKPKLGAWIWAAGDWTLGGINLSGGDVVS